MLRVDIYKGPHGGKCSNNGTSMFHDTVNLYKTKAEAIEAQPTHPETPAVYPIVRFLGGDENPYFHCVAVSDLGRQTMFGGCFLYTSDSRLKDYVGSNKPVPLHDRVE